MLVAIDLYCGGGGAALGLKWAGFHVIGIDIAKIRNYQGDHFIRADVLNELPVDLSKANLIWASPPCQKHSMGTKEANRDAHVCLISRTRQLLEGYPYTVIENVPQAPLHNDLTLWGPQFGLDSIWRKRTFELSFYVPDLPIPKLYPGTYVTIAGAMCNSNTFYKRKAEGKKGALHPIEYKHAMGIPICTKMTRQQVANAVAPDKAKYIAEHAKAQMRTGRIPIPRQLNLFTEETP